VEIKSNHQWLNTGITDLYKLGYFTALRCLGLSPVCSHDCKFLISCAYAQLWYTVSSSECLACSDSKLIPKPHILDTWHHWLSVGFTTYEHYMKLWTHMHAPDKFDICTVFVHMHAWDCSDTICDIKAYLYHTVTFYTHTLKKMAKSKDAIGHKHNAMKIYGLPSRLKLTLSSLRVAPLLMRKVKHWNVQE
jgi:hypothetical protein